ncbi:unnamed protein product [Amoebophrya sp. A25]|nr:unnamed protein product [Amoebophrya sp. A25]|eukprot:GSA25T00004956001.1
MSGLSKILLEDEDEGFRFVCQDCGRQYQSRSTYQAHRKKEHGVWLGKYSCSLCPAAFKHRGSLQRHLILHEQGKVDENGLGVVQRNKVNASSLTASSSSVKRTSSTVENSIIMKKNLKSKAAATTITGQEQDLQHQNQDHPLVSAEQLPRKRKNPELDHSSLSLEEFFSDFSGHEWLPEPDEHPQKTSSQDVFLLNEPDKRTSREHSTRGASVSRGAASSTRAESKERGRSTSRDNLDDVDLDVDMLMSDGDVAGEDTDHLHLDEQLHQEILSEQEEEMKIRGEEEDEDADIIAEDDIVPEDDDLVPEDADNLDLFAAPQIVKKKTGPAPKKQADQARDQKRQKIASLPDLFAESAGIWG